MKITFVIIISLISLGFCLSLPKVIEPNDTSIARSTSISTKSREPRALPALIAGAVIVIEAINLITTLILGIKGMIDLVNPDKSDGEYKKNVIAKLDKIYEVCMKIDEMNKKMDHLNVVIKENADRTIDYVEATYAKSIVAGFKKNLDFVNRIFEDKFFAVWNEMKHYQPETVSSHFLEIIQNSQFLKAMSDMMTDITAAPKSGSNIFWAMSEYYDTKNNYEFSCENVSPLDNLHNFYVYVLTTFTKGYVVLLLSHQYLMKTSNDSRYYHDLQNTVFKRFKTEMTDITNHTVINFNVAESNYRASYACDPKEWKEGQNFIRVKNYVSVQFTAYLANYNYTSEPVNKFNEYDCYHPGGAVYKSANKDEHDTETEFCTTPFAPTLVNPYSKEYQEMNPGGRLLGSRRCMPWSSNYFSEICEADHNSDPDLSIRKLSLRIQTCDTSKNEVVTDARFQEQDNKIYIQLRCGVLKDGSIDSLTLRWTKDTKPYSEIEPREYVVLSSKLKSFNIDNVVVPNGELVTGAGFEVVDDHFISLVVQGSKVNNYNHGNTFGAAKLHSVPKPKYPSLHHRQHINISYRQRPPRIMDQTYEKGKEGENYINLTISSWSDDHNNEAIVPYFDMTAYGERSGNPSVTPLGGLGLFYKENNSPKSQDYAGFLALKHLSPVHVYYIFNDDRFQSSITEAKEKILNWGDKSGNY